MQLAKEAEILKEIRNSEEASEGILAKAELEKKPALLGMLWKEVLGILQKEIRGKQQVILKLF